MTRPMSALDNYVAALTADLTKALAIAKTIDNTTRGQDIDYIEQVLERTKVDLEPIKRWAEATGRYVK